MPRVGHALYRRLGEDDRAHGLLGQPRRGLLHAQQHYIESVWNLLQKIWDKDLIYRGYKVVPYDPRIGATLSSHELAQGYQDTEDPSITVRFRLQGEENTSILVWTTTPWTLPSNLALAVGDGHRLQLLRGRWGDVDRCRSTARGCHARPRTHVYKTVKGSELVGTRYEQLFDYLEVDSDAIPGLCG